MPLAVPYISVGAACVLMYASQPVAGAGSDMCVDVVLIWNRGVTHFDHPGLCQLQQHIFNQNSRTQKCSNAPCDFSTFRVMRFHAFLVTSFPSVLGDSVLCRFGAQRKLQKGESPLARLSETTISNNIATCVLLYFCACQFGAALPCEKPRLWLPPFSSFGNRPFGGKRRCETVWPGDGFSALAATQNPRRGLRRSTCRKRRSRRWHVRLRRDNCVGRRLLLCGTARLLPFDATARWRLGVPSVVASLCK